MTALKAVLIRRIRDREARIAVIGLGYVGLPTAVVFSNAGFHVTGIDIDQKVVETVSNGECLTDEPGLKRLINQVRRKGLFEVVSDGEAVLGKSDVIFVHVPTPKKDDGMPDLSYVEKVCNQVARHLRKGRLVIVASTLPPNTTKGFVAPLLERGSGLRCGIDFWLAYCPERIAPGKALEEFVENDRLIGGYDAESAELANEVFKTVVKGDMFLADATAVEVAKLAENTYRDVNIAFANELALICENVGVDVVKVVELANTHPRVNILKSGPGVGGPCLPKDPYLLATVASDPHAHQVIIGSRMVNDFMASHCVDLVLRAIGESGVEVKDARVLALGLGYKADVGDTRNSPSKRIVEKLVNLGLNVTVHDPHSKENCGVKRAKSLEEAIRNADCVVVATAHSVYRVLPKIIEKIPNKPSVVDLVRLLRKEDVVRVGTKYFGIGLGNVTARTHKGLSILGTLCMHSSANKSEQKQ